MLSEWFFLVLTNKGRLNLCSFLLGVFFIASQCLPTYAREQYQMNHPGPWKPQAPPANYGLVPQFSPDFWQGQIQSRIPAGTVLSLILEDDLSSSKNKVGDVFSLRLQDGFNLNGRLLIPANAKIIGSVLAAIPAKDMKGGQPGHLEVSLKAMVLPDGQHMPFCGFIDCNPNQLYKEEPSQRKLGKSMKDYGQSVGAFFGSFTAGWGFALNRRHRGQDFDLPKGEVLPVRLSRSLDMSLVALKNASSLPASSLPSLGSHVPMDSSNARQMSNPPSAIAPVPNDWGTQLSPPPGLVGTDPDNPVMNKTGNNPEDSNAIFHQPLYPTPSIKAPEEPF